MMTDTQLTEKSSLNDWVRENGQYATVFEELGLDYCCGGQQTLSEACRDKGLPAEDVLHRLASLEAGRGDAATDPEPDWDAMSLEEVVDHIVGKHHVYLKASLPHITELIDKVVAAHGHRHPELKELAVRYCELRNDLEPHLMKEERILFPMIVDMEESGVSRSGCGAGPSGPVHVMLGEHERAGKLLELIREITRDYEVPEDACATYRQLMAELQHLEADTHRHIFLENAVLFPRALEMSRA